MSNKKAKTSVLWSYFVVKDAQKKTALCDICGQVLNFGATISNLKKHLNTRHPTVQLPAVSKNERFNINKPSSSKTDISSDAFDPCCPSTSTSSIPGPEQSKSSYIVVEHQEKTQTDIRSHLPVTKKISEVQKKRLDKLLFGMIIKDFQPFSVVEDSGFVEFVYGLNPSYKLPSRKTLTNSLLPAEYEKCVNEVRKGLVSVDSVCITTDCWTSINMDGYIAVTAHYITDEFILRSVLLECSVLDSPHTSSNLAKAIHRILEAFHLNDKVIVIVSDNASNMKSAVEKELRMKHFGCFAHTLNLILQDALKTTNELIIKLKVIVSYFKRSSSGLERLNSVQKNMGLVPKKLVQEVATRWNSTYYMVERCVELKDALKTTIALINKDIPVLTEEEWTTCSELCTILEPFEEVTKQISGEKYVTGSLIIPLTNGLKSVCQSMLKETFGNVARQVVSDLLNGIKTRLTNIENSKTLSLATLLDPRFKLAPFENESSAKAAKELCINHLAKIWELKKTTSTARVANDEHSKDDEDCSQKKRKFSVWDSVDSIILTKNNSGTKTSAAIVEINRYLEEGYLDRKQDPLIWWKNNKCYYPLMANLVKSKFNAMGTSVPCERLFSKAGNLISERRSRLKSKNVEKILFLNVNSSQK